MDTMCFGYISRGILSVSFTNSKKVHKCEVQHYHVVGIFYFIVSLTAFDFGFIELKVV